jgi:putative transposase
MYVSVDKAMQYAIKSVKLSFIPTPQIDNMMEKFRQMVNDCIRVDLQYDISSMKLLCKLTYKQLACYDIITYYKLCTISHAAGILANRKKSLKRGLYPRKPYAIRPLLISCYGFKIVDGFLKVLLGNKQYFDIPLNGYVKKVLSDRSLKVRSFTLTPDAVSICYSKEAEDVECSNMAGVDRNLRNLTVGM